jgi:translation initiation factor IF-3
MKKQIQPRVIINNRIRAEKVRLIDESGQQVGVLPLQEAINRAKERGLDLIQITEKVDPPVCKITDYGKYLYGLKKKERKVKHYAGELKGIRLTFGISEHDLQTRARQAEKFLKKGDKIRIELRLRGREKAHQDFAREKIKKFIEELQKTIEVKIEKDLKKEPRGLIMIISRS